MSIKRTVDSYGFESLEVNTEGGGSKTITFYGGSVDIASVSSSNGRGLGSSDYIRSIDDVQRHIRNTEETVWLTDEEKGAINTFLMEIWKCTEGFLKVKERFNVTRTYEQDKTVYTFTEKPEKVITLHTQISINIAVPKMWNESDAWRSLAAVLNPNILSAEERFALKD